MKQYEVKYDVDLHFPGNMATVRTHVLVNGEGTLPGYRVACTAQTDYRLLIPHQGEITRDQLTPDDMEFFIADTHLCKPDRYKSSYIELT